VNDRATPSAADRDKQAPETVAQHPVVRQRVDGLFQIDPQLVGLDAAKDGCTQVRDADVPAPDAVGIETLIAVPRFQKESALALTFFALPRRNQPHQLIPQHQQARWVFAQQFAQLLYRAVIGLVAVQRRGFRRLLAVCPQFLGDERGIALAGFLGRLLDARFDGVLLCVEDHFLGLEVGLSRGMRSQRRRNQTIQRL
jgi:hypothetical protein